MKHRPSTRAALLAVASLSSPYACGRSEQGGDAGIGGVTSLSGGQPLAAGGSGVTSGGHTASGATGAGGEALGGHAGEAPSLPLCFHAEGLPSCESLDRWGILVLPRATPTKILNAEDLAADARFIAQRGDAAVIELPSADPENHFKIAHINTDPIPSEEVARILDVSWPAAMGDWSIVAVETPYEAQARILAIACDAEKCVRLGGDLRATAMTPLNEPALPLDLNLALTSRHDCVFGDKIYCLKAGAWTEGPALPGNTGSRFVALEPNFARAAAEQFGPSAAVTDRGAVLVEAENGVWQTVRKPGSRIQSAAIQWPLVSVLSEDATWYEFDLSTELGRECQQSVPLKFAAPLQYATGSYVALGQDGQTYVRTLLLESSEPISYVPAWCTHSPQPFDGLKAAVAVPCGASDNFYGISDTSLWSLLRPPECASTP